MPNDGFEGNKGPQPLQSTGERTLLGSAVEGLLFGAAITAVDVAKGATLYARNQFVIARNHARSIRGLAILDALGAETWRTGNYTIDTSPAEPIIPVTEEQK